jgi:hypothetical protein
MLSLPLAVRIVVHREPTDLRRSFDSLDHVGVDPFGCRRDVIERVSTHPMSRIGELTPRPWQQRRQAPRPEPAAARTPAGPAPRRGAGSWRQALFQDDADVGVGLATRLRRAEWLTPPCRRSIVIPA